MRIAWLSWSDAWMNWMTRRSSRRCSAQPLEGKNSRMKVSDALASAFVKEGVTTVFGLMGNGNMYWWHALDQHPDVAIHETRHEGTALTMAEGWARATVH